MQLAGEMAEDCPWRGGRALPVEPNSLTRVSSVQVLGPDSKWRHHSIQKGAILIIGSPGSMLDVRIDSNLDNVRKFTKYVLNVIY